MSDKRDPEEVRQELEQIERDIKILKSRKMIEDSKCAICNKDGCDVISFEHRKPVHAKCLHNKD